MRITRIYQPINLIENQIITLDNHASHHLLNVLRLKSGTTLIIFNGQGGEYQAELINIEKKQAKIKIKNFSAIERESSLHIHLAQGISRGEKMDYIIQKAVELGVTEITPLFTEYGNVHLNEERLKKRVAHWQAIIISACEQCGRNHLPKINLPQRLFNWLPNCHDEFKLILDPQANKKISEYNKQNSVTLLIGPEGGLSDHEIAEAKRNNFLSLKLGPRILRTETAGLAAVAALQALWGDLG